MLDAPPPPPSEKKCDCRDRRLGPAHCKRLRSGRCRVPSCVKKTRLVHGLCHKHRDQIAYAFEQFYLAAQGLIEDLQSCDLKVLPSARIDNPFIRLCDRFVNDALSQQFEE